MHLENLVIGNGVIEIKDNAFSDRNNLTNVSIGRNVKTIGSDAFNCENLTSITIPNSVTSIGNGAFYSNNLTTVISMIEDPFIIHGKTATIGTGVFLPNTFSSAILYVPDGTKEKYKNTNGWMDFTFIKDSNDGGAFAIDKCATPIIEYKNNKLSFTSETEGAMCNYSITDTDILSGQGAEINLTVTYTVRVYASKAGCYDSETAVGTLCWIDTTPTTEGITGIAQIPANAVLIQANDGFISISGIDESKQIAIYQTDGKQVATAKAYNGSASVATNISRGTPVIVKIGEKAVKVVMQ